MAMATLLSRDDDITKILLLKQKELLVYEI